MRLALLSLLVLAACVRAPSTRRHVGITHVEARRGDRDLTPQLWYPATPGTDDVSRDVLAFFESALAQQVAR